MLDNISAEFIRRIPKSDLHLHLDGSLRLKTLIELAHQEKVKLPSRTESGMRELVFKSSYNSLREYLKGFAYTCAVLRSPENLARVAQELVEDNAAEGVRYIEVRFAPQLHVCDRLTSTDAVRAVAQGLWAGAKAHNRKPEVRKGKDLPFHYGIIVCGMRRFSAGMSPYYANLLSIMEHADKDDIYSAASLELSRSAVAWSQAGIPWSASTWPARKLATPRSTTARPTNTPTTTSSARPCTPARPTARSPSGRPSPNATPTASGTGLSSLRTT